MSNRMQSDGRTASSRLGRYTVHREFASGGMGTLYLGLAHAAGGFCRLVAIKSLRAGGDDHADLKLMMIDEARLVARIRHPNVVPVLDVMVDGADLYLVMEYVHGESLSLLLRRARAMGVAVPARVLVSVLADVLRGLHAAHQAVDRDGQPLGLVHRDVSPDNVLVGADGLSRITDFGIAKAKGRLQAATEGNVRGKLGYMAPEQLTRRNVDHRADIYAAGIILWEGIVGRRRYNATDEAGMVGEFMFDAVERPSAATGREEPLDDVVMRALGRDPESRFPTAAAMVDAMTERLPPARRDDVAAWVQSLVGAELAQRDALLRELEREAELMSVAPDDPPDSSLTPTRFFSCSLPSRGGFAIFAVFAILMMAAAVTAFWVASGLGPLRDTAAAPLPSFSVTTVPMPSATPAPTRAGSTELCAPAPVRSVATPWPACSPDPARTPRRSTISKKRNGSPASPRTSSSAVDCKPPYTLDSNGNKRYKLECL